MRRKCHLKSQISSKMPLVFAVIFIGTVLWAAALQNSESNSTLLTSKIYGGEKASQSDVVYIRQNGQNKCGGAMINYLVVLTAAHCVYESEINSYNDLEIVHDMKVHGIKRAIIHPDFDSHTDPHYVADIALLLLKQCKYVNPEYAIVFSKIPISSKLIKSNSSAYVYGWGSLNPYRRNIAAEHLQRLKVTIISNNKCRKRFDSVKIQESHMCAISPHGSFAPEDAGSPLIEHFDITDGKPIKKCIGIATFSHGIPNFPSVYTRISSYYKFISTNIMNLVDQARNTAPYEEDSPETSVASPMPHSPENYSQHPLNDSIDGNSNHKTHKKFGSIIKIFKRPLKSNKS